jgi:Fe-S-cluster containining protein
MSEVACSNCEGACCQGGNMDLSMEEASFLVEKGASLLLLVPPEDYDRDEVISPLTIMVSEDSPSEFKMASTMEPLAAGFGRFIMTRVCPYLDESSEGWPKCTAYEDRPAACRNFEMGSESCLSARQTYGVDELTRQHVELNRQIRTRLGVEEGSE